MVNPRHPKNSIQANAKELNALRTYLKVEERGEQRREGEQELQRGGEKVNPDDRTVSEDQG